MDSFWVSFGDCRKKATRYLTFILKCNETQGKVDPGVIILYNIPDDSFQKVILTVSKYQYQEQGRKSECWCWLWIPRAGDVGPAAKVCVQKGKNVLPEWGIALSQMSFVSVRQDSASSLSLHLHLQLSDAWVFQYQLVLVHGHLQRWPWKSSCSHQLQELWHHAHISPVINEPATSY